MERSDIPDAIQADKLRAGMLEEHMHGDPEDYENPRFLDPLEPELEEAWQQIADSIRQKGSSTIPAMSKIWNDTSLHEAIRDRALIVARGSYKAAGLLGFETIRGSFGGDKFKVNDDLEDEFDNWHLEAIGRQHTTGVEILNPYGYLAWSISFFRKGIIDQNQFEEYLQMVDIRKAQPNFGDAPQWALESPRFEGNRLEYDRFPLLADIFFGFYGKDKKLQDWAQDKLSHWLAHKLDPSTPSSSPEWLDWEDGNQAFWLSNWLLHKDKIKDLTVRKGMIEVFGWSILHPDAKWNGIYARTRLTLQEGLDISLNTQDPDEKLGIIEHVLLLNQKRRSIVEEGKGDRLSERDWPQTLDRKYYLDILESLLISTDPESDLASMIKTELKHTREQIEKLENEKAERDRKNEAKDMKREEKSQAEQAKRTKAGETLASALAKARKS